MSIERSRTRTLVVVVIALPLLAAAGAAAGMSQERIDRIRDEIARQGMKWKAAKTSMTRLSDEQRAARLIRLEPRAPMEAPGVPSPDSHFPPPPPPPSPVPDPGDPSFDWADVDGQDWTSPVQDQGDCGSCTIFASVAAMEGSLNVSYGHPDLDYDLSEQNLLSCTAATCETGSVSPAQGITYVADNGLPDEGCHPYTATDGSCSDACADMESRLSTIASWGWVASDVWSAPTELEIKEALVYGPITTTMNVYSDFFAYSGGVYEKTSSATLEGGHAIVIVGWNDDNDSWYAKNSWGTGWGDDGFFEIKRGECDFGGAFSSWISMDAEGILGAFDVTDSSLSATVDFGSGDVVDRYTSIVMTVGDAGLPFLVETGEDAPWLEVAPLEGDVAMDAGVELTYTFDESKLEAETGGLFVHDTFVVDGHGLSRRVQARFQVNGGPSTDSDTDTDTDSDADADTDSDGDTDADTEADAGPDAGSSGDESGSCGCRSVGRAQLSERAILSRLAAAVF